MRSRLTRAETTPHGASAARWLVAVAALLGLSCGPTVGDPCTTGSDCLEQVCLNRDFTPGGYCSRSCDPNADTCPTGSLCVHDAIARDVAGCMRVCKDVKECRQGYTCQTLRNQNVKVCIGPEGL